MHLGFLILRKYYFEFEQKFREMSTQNDCSNHKNQIKGVPKLFDQF